MLLLFLVILLGFSAFFSGSETALFSLNHLAVEKLKHIKPERGLIISRLLGNPRRLLVSIVVGNMLVNILSSTIAERASAGIFSSGPLSSLAWVFSTIVMTFLILILGEVAPKILAINRAESFSLAVAPAISILEKVVAPIRTVVHFTSDRVISLFEKKKPSPDTPLTREELTTALHLGSREGTLNGEEKEMITEIFNLGDKSIRQLMTPRNEIVSFEVDTPLEEIAAVIKEKEYSRIPIYSGKVENVIGIFYPKDLVMTLARRVERIALGDCLRKPYFVPEIMKASRLLKEFLARKIHIALVVDEYGGISGLITLDDLIEEIVGEIRERGEAPPDFEILNEDTIQLRGRMELDYVNDEFDLDLTGDKNVTLGGYLCEKLGHIPQPGETYQEGSLWFKVVNLKGRRIGQVLISRKGIGKEAGIRPLDRS
ncbi:MAG: hemolysin family protein [Candidatus Euphemobacter frigidus]|nr:hemolysin family protein [Candidatus Euphemobacter frigidus]MDP8276277.1 hemolysin family protein [Candidatus Euphemobacter frigidus]